MKFTDAHKEVFMVLWTLDYGTCFKSNGVPYIVVDPAILTNMPTFDIDKCYAFCFENNRLVTFDENILVEVVQGTVVFE